MRRPLAYLVVPTLVLALLTAAIVVASLFDTARPLPPVVQTGGPPPLYWQYPKSHSAYASGVAVTSLACEMVVNGYDLATQTASTPTLVYVQALIAITSDSRGTAAPVLSTLRASDSLGNVYDVTYTEALNEDGLAAGTVWFRGSPDGRKTFSLTLGRVEVTSSDGSKSSVDGPWHLDLVEQTGDNLRVGESVGGPSQDPPIDLGPYKATTYLGGSGPDGFWQTQEFEGLPRGKVTIGIFSRSDLSVQSVNRG